MKKTFKILFLALVVAIAWPSPRAEAIDPVTIAVLAPIALRAAEAARPYLIRAALNTGKSLIKIGKDVWQMMYLPYGFMKATIGAPLGGFRSGVIYMIRGSVAPVKLIFHVLTLPLMMCGLDLNM